MESTYLAWFDVTRLELEKPVTFFEDHGVGLSDGTPFDGIQHLRLNFGCPRSRLLEGLEKMAAALNRPITSQVKPHPISDLRSHYEEWNQSA